MDEKIYEGSRGLLGAVVAVDGLRLNPRYDLKRYSPAGFERSCDGDGPRQVALALLAEHLQNDAKALALTEPFMRAVVANLDNDWELTEEEIAAAVKGLP